MRLRLRAVVVRCCVAAAVAVAATGSQAASTTYTHGYDVSWPQCNGSRAAHLPSSAHFLVLGLTHGSGHTANPCVASQLSWAKAHKIPVGAYLVPSYPTSAQLAAAGHGRYGDCGSNVVCRRRNDGAAQAASALSVMRRAGVPAPMVWVDVEYRHVHPWTHDHGANVQVLEGVLRGLSDAHLPYGVYTTPTMWRNITGGWSLKVPNWLPGGGSDAASARSACRTSGTGGRTWLGQYTREFDEDLTCPVMDATPGHPGPLWPYRNTTLSLGSTGAAVRALQGALKVNVTGTYDAATTSAVVQFQLAHSLPVNGRVDTDDWRALGAFRWIGAHGFWLSRVARLA